MDIERIKLFRKKLRFLEMEMDEHVKQNCLCFGISLSQCHTLLEIGDKKEMSIVELASILGVDTSTLSRTIDGMVNIGLVNRRPNPEDRRYVSISLTKKGETLYKSIEEFYNDYFSRVFELIPEEKHQQVMESFILFSDAIKKVKGNK